MTAFLYQRSLMAGAGWRSAGTRRDAAPHSFHMVLQPHCGHGPGGASARMASSAVAATGCAGVDVGGGFSLASSAGNGVLQRGHSIVGLPQPHRVFVRTTRHRSGYSETDVDGAL